MRSLPRSSFMGIMVGRGARRIAGGAAIALLACSHPSDSDRSAGAFAAAADRDLRVCDPITCDPPEVDPAFAPAMVERVVPSGGRAMNAVAYLPAGAGPHPVVILLHGFPGYERNGDLAHAIRRAGFTVLFFHYRGAWGSEGDFTFAGAIDDAEAAVDFVATPAFQSDARADANRIALVGHSMGGFVALQAAARRTQVGCTVSLAGANLGRMAAAATDPEMRPRLQAMLRSWSGPIRMAKDHDLVAELAGSVSDFDLERLVSRLAGRPVLLVAGLRDRVTPPDQHHEPLRAAFAAAGAGQVAAVSIDADHGFSGRRIELTRVVVDWLGQHCR